MRRSPVFCAVLLVLALVSPGYAAPFGLAPGDADSDAMTDKVNPVLGANGQFIGAAGGSGSVDLTEWSLASDISTGEAPRFAAANGATESPGTNWSALGSNGSGNGAIGGTVRAMVLMGTTLYVAGDFVNAAGIAKADYIAGWDGSAWFALGSSGPFASALNGPVRALAVLDNVHGNRLYAGGDFTDAAGIAKADYVAAWDGSAWTSLERDDVTVPSLNGPVFAFARGVVSDLHIGGEFTNAAGIAAADYVVRWGAGSWHALGGGSNGALNAPVRALLQWDSTVYAGGSFTNAAGIATADHIANWNFWTNSWSSPGANGGADGALAGDVLALARRHSTGELFVGGSFVNAAGLPAADYIVRWQAGAWSALGDNGAGNGALGGSVRAIAVSDGLYVGGSFTNAGGQERADYAALWHDDAWSPLGESGGAALGGAVHAFLVQPTKKLYVGGEFNDAGGVATGDRVAATAIGPWFALGSDGAGNGAINLSAFSVYAIAVIAEDLYVGGSFTNAAGILEADGIARWDGTRWHALGSNGAGNGALNGWDVYALAVMDGDLYVGGSFTLSRVTPEVNHLARWDGSSWSAVGGLEGDSRLVAPVKSIAVAGNSLYIGGGFTDLAGIPAADSIARWDGSSWSALGSDAALNSAVVAIAVDGESVYAGGLFTDAAGIPEADHVARWDGSTWSALGSGGPGNGALSGRVHALAAADGQLLVGGEFLNAAGNPDADRIARWDGEDWSSLGAGGSVGAVHAIAVAGADVYVGGFANDWAGIPEADAIARWDGTKWNALGSNDVGDGALKWRNTTYSVHALAIGGRDLFVGGTFRNAAGIPEADYVAAFGPISGPPVVDPPVVVRQPDGRIRKGTGQLVGDDIYDPRAGASQSRTGAAIPGRTVTFAISIQNDGTDADAFRVTALGAAVQGYAIRYFRGTTEITAAVVAGTYVTPQLAPGATHLIKAKVRVKRGASVGSRTTRLVTLASVADGAVIDAVRFAVKRR